MTRFVNVKSLLVISSVCLETQSMINSGNPEILLLFTFTILPISKGFELSISISMAVPEEPGSPSFIAGPQRLTDFPQRAEIFL